MAANYQMFLEFVLDLKSDKSKVKKVANEIEKTIKEIDPKIDIDTSKIEAGLKDIIYSFDSIEDAAGSLDKVLNKLDIDIDNDEAMRALDEVQKMVKNIDQMDLDIFEEELSKIPTSELDKIRNALQDAFENFDTKKLDAALNKAASDFDELKSKAMQNFDVALKATQKLVLEGKENTAEYKKSLAELKKRKKAIQEVERAEKKVTQAIEATTKKGYDFQAFIFKLQAVQQIAEAFSTIVDAGVEFEKTLHEVGAITGFVGEKLDEMGVAARHLALEFGGTATDQLKSFQGILSKLGPQLAETPAALELMAKNINILSKASGMDATQSMNSLIDTMLQLGLVSGDSMKDAEASTRVINALAASAQVGAAEIPQVADALLQAGVMAKGANQDLVKVNAAIQVLAVGGKTGSEAGVALRNVMGFLQKAAGPAAAAMRELGTSSKELGELLTTKGLDAALTKLREGMNLLGSDAEKNVAMMDIFGMENAAAAGILMDNLDKFKEFELGIETGTRGIGSAFEQANINMDTSAHQISVTQAYINDLWISITQAMGQGLTTIMGAAAQMAPLMMSLTGAFQVFGQMAPSIKKTATALLTRFIPSLVATESATTGAKIAQWALNAAQLAMPTLAVIAGVIAIGAVLKGLAETLNVTAKEQLEVVEAEKKGIEADIQLITQQKERLKNNLALIETYKELGNKTNLTELEEKKLHQTMLALSGAYPGAIDRTKTFEENLESLASEAGNTREKLYEVTDKMVEMERKSQELDLKAVQLKVEVAKENIEDVLADYYNSWEAAIQGKTAYFGGPIGQSILEFFRLGSFGRNAAKSLMEEYTAGMKEASTVGEVQDAMLEFQMMILNSTELPQKLKDKLVQEIADLGEKQIEVLEKNKKLAQDQLNMRVDIFQKNVDDIAELNARITEGKATEVDKKRYDVLMNRVEQYKQGITDEGKLYTENMLVLKQLKKEIDFEEEIGGNTKELEKQRQEILNQVETQKTAIAAMMSAAIKSGTVDSSVFYKKMMVDIGEGTDMAEEEFSMFFSDIGRQVEEADFSTKIQEAVEIKESIDKHDKVGELVKKFKDAKNDIVKANIAKEIAKQAPEAVKATGTVTDEQNKLITTYDVATEKVEEYAKAHKDSLTGELLRKQDEFNDKIIEQADIYDDNMVKLEELKNKIVMKDQIGENTAALRQQYETIRVTTQANINDTINMLAQSEEAGFATESAYVKVADSLGLSVEEVKKLVAEQKKSIEETKEQVNWVEQLSSAWNKAKSDAKKSYDTNLAVLKQLKLEEEEVGKLSVEQAKTRAEALQGVVDARKEMKKQQEAETAVMKEYRLEQAKTTKTTTKRAEVEKDILKTIEEQYKTFEAELNYNKRIFEYTQNEKIIEEARQRTTRDDLVLQSFILTNLEEQRKTYTEILNEMGKINDAGVLIGLEIEQKTEIEKKLLGFDEQIQDQSVVVQDIAIGIEMDEADIARELDELEIRKIRLEIDLGIREEGDLQDIVAIYQKRLAVIKARMSEINTETKAGALEFNQLKNEELEMIKTIRDEEKSILDERLRNVEKHHQEALEVLNNRYGEEEELLNKFNATYGRATNDRLASEREQILESLGTGEEERIKRLEELVKNEQITEQAAENEKIRIREEGLKKRKELEDKYNIQLKMAQDMQAGMLIALQRNKNIVMFQKEADAAKEIYDMQLRNLEEKRALGKHISEQEIEAVAELEKNMLKAQKIVDDKSNVLIVGLADLVDQTGKFMSEMFAGDPEAFRNNAREFMATQAGILQAMASAAVLKWVLSPGVFDTFAFLPFPLQIAAQAFASLTIRSIIKALTDPLISKMLSFGTGGRYDSPTVTTSGYIAGDASISGTRDTEWITRDRDIQAIVEMTVYSTITPLLREMQLLRQSITQQKLVTQIKGRNLKLLIDRERVYEREMSINGY